MPPHVPQNIFHAGVGKAAALLWQCLPCSMFSGMGSWISCIHGVLPDVCTIRAYVLAATVAGHPEHCNINCMESYKALCCAIACNYTFAAHVVFHACGFIFQMGARVSNFQSAERPTSHAASMHSNILSVFAGHQHCCCKDC